MPQRTGKVGSIAVGNLTPDQNNCRPSAHPLAGTPPTEALAEAGVRAGFHPEFLAAGPVRWDSIPPMIDATTGTLSFERPPTVIGPTLTRDRFLASSLSQGATTHVANEPYHSWKLQGTCRSAGLDFVVVLWFHGPQLTMVSLMDPDPRFGTSWSDHSLQNEMARKASHDAWLSRAVSPQCNDSWGTIWSGYDEQGGFSQILIRYASA